MSGKKKSSTHDPKGILQEAIEEIDLFAQAEESRLDVSENGRLVASKESLLKKMVGLARHIGSIFSPDRRKEQAKKLDELKQALLNARDIIQSHSALIIKFKEGDEAQRKLADYALSAIQRYNAVVAHHRTRQTAKYDVYNYERKSLLSDEEIKGKPIILPHSLSIKFDSHPDIHPAYKMFREMHQANPSKAENKSAVAPGPTHKKTLQFMIDTFHMKAIRMMQTHLSQQNSMADIVSIVKCAPLDIDAESNPDLIAMQQSVQVGPGFNILVSGCFKRNRSDPQFLSMPILDSFRLTFQLTHTGFPYPSQHTGWALSDAWAQAYPLRPDQVPLFQKIDERKKLLAQQLLYDQTFIQKARKRAKIKREVFDQHRHLFLPLHDQLQQTLHRGFSRKAACQAFFKELQQAPSPFDLLFQTEQQMQDLLMCQPIRALEEEWLGNEATLLRTGTPQEKFYAACERLTYFQKRAFETLDQTLPQHAYMIAQGEVLGRAFQSIGLQYQSEKMGFCPPLLNEFERQLQLCAFRQLLNFMEECENLSDVSEPSQIKKDLLDSWTQDLKIFQTPSIEKEHHLLFAIVDELEVYFNSRFFASQPYSFGKVI